MVIDFTSFCTLVSLIFYEELRCRGLVFEEQDGESW